MLENRKRPVSDKRKQQLFIIIKKEDYPIAGGPLQKGGNTRKPYVIRVDSFPFFYTLRKNKKRFDDRFYRVRRLYAVLIIRRQEYREQLTI